MVSSVRDSQSQYGRVKANKREREREERKRKEVKDSKERSSMLPNL